MKTCEKKRKRHPMAFVHNVHQMQPGTGQGVTEFPHQRHCLSLSHFQSITCPSILSRSTLSGYNSPQTLQSTPPLPDDLLPFLRM